MSTRNQREKQEEISVNLRQNNKLVEKYGVLGPPPPYQNWSDDEDDRYSTKLSNNAGDFVKPELPKFLQNMGPGLSPLRENLPITLSWLDVRAQAPYKQGFIKRKMNQCLGKEIEQPKQLLKSVSGMVKPGEMCAIMGASGAGKTTLMNILTHRRTGDLEINGDVRINSRKMKNDISGISCFVQQEELFIGSLTIREHLQFHAMLRLGKDFTKDEKLKRVDEVLNFLNLSKAENTTIGIHGVTKGLSGGEKRRLTFATEILNDPPLLFCDEPTTGLDSSMAFILVQAMRKLTDQGKTIICTIHQPSSEIFFLFDKLYLLAEGRLAYFGTIEKAPAFFRQFGLEIPRNHNPSDFFIQKLAIYPKTREENMAQVDEICDGYENSSQNARYMSEIMSLHASYDDDDEGNDSYFVRIFKRCAWKHKRFESDAGDVQEKKKSRYATNSFTQFRWLLWRNFLDAFKNPFEAQLRTILAIFFGVLVGLLYFRLKYDQANVQNFNALIFLLIINTSFANLFAVTQSYTREFPIFYKEHDDAVYRVTPYYFAKLVTEIPLFAITILLQITITYWMTNLFATAKRFFIFFIIIILTSFVSIAMGALLSVVTNTPEQAQALQVPILLPLMVFGGFFLNNQSGQVWLNWLKYLSWFYYGNEALIINQWKDVDDISCDGIEAGLPCYRNIDDILRLLDFQESNFGRDVILIIVLWVGIRLLSYLVLLYKAKYHK